MTTHCDSLEKKKISFFFNSHLMCIIPSNKKRELNNRIRYFRKVSKSYHSGRRKEKVKCDKKIVK